MARYIDADELKSKVNLMSTHWLNEWDTLGVLAVIDSAQTSDAQEVRRGKWLFCASTEDLMCSNCLHYWIPNGDQYDYHYCPNCGAKMDMKGE